MTPLSVNDLTHNAYRVLGLTAAATQMDIDAAARRLRIWDDPVQIPPTANDAPWMGPVPRSRRDIETAVARLADPECRIEERLWWFCTTPPSSDDAAPAAGNVKTAHDAALVQLHRALITQNNHTLASWRDLLRQFEALADAGDYLTWLLAVEADGDFEKRATPEEVAAAQSGLTTRLQSALAKNVETALDDENFAAARETIQLMQRQSSAASTAAATLASPAEKALGRLEDLLIQRCETLRDQVHQAWNTRKIAILKPACRRCMMQFPKEVLPLIEELRVLCAGDFDRVQRAQIHGANVLIYTADAFEGCYDYFAAWRTLLQAKALVQGTAMESTLQRRIEGSEIDARRQRLGTGPATSMKPGLRGTVPSNRPFKVIGTGNRNYAGSWFSAFPKRSIAILVIVVVSALSGFLSKQTQPPAQQQVVPRFDGSALHSPLPPKRVDSAIHPPALTLDHHD